MKEEKKSYGESIADVIGGLIFILFVILICGLVTVADFQDMRKKIQDGDVTSIEGIVESCEIKEESCLVTFKDGRKKTFNGISPKPIDKDKYCVIQYSGSGKILNVEEK